MNLNATIWPEPGTLTANDTTTTQKAATVQARRTSTGQTALIAGFSAVLIFGVLAYCVFDQYAIGILEIGSALLLLLWTWPQISSGRLQLSSNRLYALVQDLTPNGKIFWYWPAVSGRIFGPYANHSHCAGLMEMLAPIPLAMALTDRARRHQQMLWIAAGILMGATIFVCGSRGGMIAFAAEMMFLAGLFVARSSPRTAWALCAICLVIGAFVFWIDDGRVLKQLDSLRDPLTNAAVTSRLAIARDSLRMVRDRPIAGWGLGLFPIIYPQYRSFSTDLLVNQAHNDYLQALVETGILGFACVLWFIGNLYHSGIRNLRAQSSMADAQVLGPLVECTGILVHSASDFNLHIPANAALFFVLCGMASNGKTLVARSMAISAGF